MARNGSGTMTIVNSFTSGTTIESAAMNSNFSDVASEITNSLARDGQAAMTGPMKAAAGTATAPGMTFGTDTDTGFFRKAANTIGVAAGGTEVFNVGPTGLSFLPSGTVMLFVQTSAPTGWTKSTAHDDKAIRIVSGTAGSGGSTAFSTVFAARTLIQANLPAVTLSVTGTTSTEADHTHGYPDKAPIGSSGTTGGGTISQNNTDTARTTDPAGGHNHTVTATTENMGSGTAVDFAVQYVDAIIATKD